MSEQAKVRFLVDYRGVLSKERYFKAGIEVALDHLMAKALVEAGRAEFVKDGGMVKAADLEKLDLDTLREMAKEAGVASHWLMKKETLIDHLRDD
jgi:hypothetical protein